MRGVAVTGAGRAGAHVLGAAALRKRWRRVGGVRALFDRAGRAWAVGDGGAAIRLYSRRGVRRSLVVVAPSRPRSLSDVSCTPISR
jgi:hypothetical protein